MGARIAAISSGVRCARSLYVRIPASQRRRSKYRAYAVDLPEVVAGPSCAAGLGVTTLRHLVLLLWQYTRQTGGHGER